MTSAKKCAKLPTMTNKSLYRKSYKVRLVGKNLAGAEVTMPRIVLEKEARKHGLTVSDFLDQFVAVAQFNSIEGVLYTFERKDNNKE